MLLDKYTTEQIAEIAKNSQSFNQFCHNLGYNSNCTKTRETVKKYVNNLNIDISHFSSTPGKTERNPENIFIENSTCDQSTLRKYYRRGNYTDYKCSICGMEPLWQGKQLTMILDHINGRNRDNRLENLRWVCPNCNQQLDTFGSKNIKYQELNK